MPDGKGDFVLSLSLRYACVDMLTDGYLISVA